MDSAWATRRRALEAPTGERRELLASARVELERAREGCRRAQATGLEAQALHLLANVEVDDGREREAEALWTRAIELLRTIDEPLQLAHKVRHLGDLHRRSGRLHDAAACYSEALALYRAHAGPAGVDLANALRPAALLAVDLGDLPRAITLWREARDLYAAARLDAGVEEAQDHLDRLERGSGPG